CRGSRRRPCPSRRAATAPCRTPARRRRIRPTPTPIRPFLPPGWTPRRRILAWIRPASLRLLPLVLHEARAERALGLVLIVGAAPEPEVVGRGSAAARHRHDVVVFQECSCFATVFVRTDVRAAAIVALPHSTLDVGGDVPRPCAGAPRLARLVRGRELLL